MTKIEKSKRFFLTPIIESKGGANFIVFCSAVLDWSNDCIYNSNFWSDGGTPTFRGRKRLKNEIKWGQNYRKIQNLVDEHKRCENKITCNYRSNLVLKWNSLFLTLLYPLINIGVFITNYSQMTPHSTRNRMILIILTIKYDEIKSRNLRKLR